MFRPLFPLFNRTDSNIPNVLLIIYAKVFELVNTNTYYIHYFTITDTL